MLHGCRFSAYAGWLRCPVQLVRIEAAWSSSPPCQHSTPITQASILRLQHMPWMRRRPAVPPLQAAHEELLHRYQELKAKKMEGLQDVLAAQAAQVLTSAVCHICDAASC
jgi:hypothetical protein